MKKIVLSRCFAGTLIALMFAFSSAKAQSCENVTVHRDSLIRSTSFYFKFDVGDKIDNYNPDELKEVVE